MNLVRKDGQAKRDAEARAVREGYLFRGSQVKMVRLLLFWVVIAAVAVGTLYFCFWRERPYVLIRFTAGRAIEATAEFRHKTKLQFAVARWEALSPGTCEDFSFLPEKLPRVNEYLQAGTMKFFPFPQYSPKYSPIQSVDGSMDLSVLMDSAGSVDPSLRKSKLLLRQVLSCDSLFKSDPTAGSYEVNLGEAVVQITEIRTNGNQALVDFRWHFESLNEMGQALQGIQSTRLRQTDDPHLTAEEKSIAPFWTGVAEFAKYDDGWRVVKINLESSRAFERWEYGPHWPDPDFNWNAFDEDENR